MSEFKLRIEPAGVDIPCAPGGGLLDAALAAGFFPYHNCRRGPCNACEAPLVSDRLSDLYAFDEAAEWEKVYPGFRFIPVLSGSEPGWTGRTGFVHEAVSADVPDLSGHEVYACGNPLMVDAACHTFVRDNRLAPENFFSDAFITCKTSAPAAADKTERDPFPSS